MSFLESVELAEDFSESNGSSSRASIHSPRISFSNEFAQLGEHHQINPACSSPHPFHNPSSSGEFEFSMNSALATAAPVRNPPMLSADELFYKGKLLPLHLPPRIRMVQDLEIQLGKDENSGRNQRGAAVSKSPPVGVMRRERSLRSPARPSVIASTLKSSSYPPPGYSSRPSSPPKSTKCTSAGSSTSSRWRDLFGLKKISSPRAPSSSSSSSSSSSGPTKLLKMIFNRNSGASSSSSGAMNPNFPSVSVHFPENSDTGTQNSTSNEAQPLLRDSSSSSDHPEASSSSNWGSSSASSSTASSSSFSADFPETLEPGPGISRKSEPSNRLANSRNRGGAIGSNPNRHRPAGTRPKPSSVSPAQSGKSSGALQRSGSNRRQSPATNQKMQLQDHVLIGNTNPTNNNKPRSHSETSWRRPVDHKVTGSGASNPSSVRVTPVLHVPACIGPSLRSVRVHGLKRLFSSSSASNAPGKTQAVM